MRKVIIFVLLLFTLLDYSPIVHAEEPEIIGYCYETRTKVKTKKVKYKAKRYLGRFRVTFYCPCARCCGRSGGRTSIGRKARSNRTVAVNPRRIPYRTRLKIGSRWTYVAEDTGGMGRNHIDIFVNSHSYALKLGVKHWKVWSWKYTTKKIKYKKKYKVKVPVYKEVNADEISD